MTDEKKTYTVQFREQFIESGIRTYIFNESESYVIILEPKHEDKYYLITAYYLRASNVQKIKNKRKRKLDKIY